MRAVTLAGGRGTRLRPLTDTRPKPLVPFMGAPYAQGLLERLGAAGVDEAVFLVGQDAEPFLPLEGLRTGVRVQVVTEEGPLDTAGAARRLFRGPARASDEPTLVCNGDILTDLSYDELVGAHTQRRATATLALTRVTDTSAFGVVVTEPDGTTTAFVEKPEPGTLDVDTVNAGTYVLAPDAFDAFPGDGPLSFERDVFPTLVEAGRTVLGIPSDAHWADLGTPRRYLDGHRAVLRGRCGWPTPLERRPHAVAVHATARVDPQARVGPHAVIGPRATVTAGSTVTDSVLLDGARVETGAVVLGSVIGFDAVVAAGAVAGPGTVLGDGDRIG